MHDFRRSSAVRQRAPNSQHDTHDDHQRKNASEERQYVWRQRDAEPEYDRANDDYGKNFHWWSVYVERDVKILSSSAPPSARSTRRNPVRAHASWPDERVNVYLEVNQY